MLISLLLIRPWAWESLRGVPGVCFAGAAMVVESWLTEQPERKSRGQVFVTDTMVNLAATTAGQMVLALGDVRGIFVFVLAAIVYCLALLPTAISATATPPPRRRRSRSSGWICRGCGATRRWLSVLMVEVSNGAFGTLAVVYGTRAGLDQQQAALLASLPIPTGAPAQFPVGWLSDRFDRRRVLVSVALMGLAADLAFVVVFADTALRGLGLVAVLGAAIFAMYPVILAHARDHAAPCDDIRVSGGRLLIFGIGSIFGPPVAGFGMTSLGAPTRFAITGCAHLSIVIFALDRVGQAAPVPEHEKADLVVNALARTSTPEIAALAEPAAPAL